MSSIRAIRVGLTKTPTTVDRSIEPNHSTAKIIPSARLCLFKNPALRIHKKKNNPPPETFPPPLKNKALQPRHRSA
jgi:hypothetical protein